MNSPSVIRLAADLGRAKSPDDFHAALRRALASYDERNTAGMERSGSTFACHAGCSLCCWLRVDVYAPEVFLIAHTIRKEWATAEFKELRQSLAEHAALVTKLTPYEHATRNVACPLSRNGWCRVYAVRPHTCRRHHSQDLAACRFTYENPEDIEFPGAHHRELFRDLTVGMAEHAAVYESLGFDDTIYELGSALSEALSDPACWKRWQRKKRAFKHASVTPTA